MVEHSKQSAPPEWAILPDAGKSEPIAAHHGAPLLLRRDDFWHLQLNRPAEHNRFDPADVDALLALFEQGFREHPPAALIISGSGGRSFSSGYTLTAVAKELDSRFSRMLDVIEQLPALTIAVLNGSAYGGATDLALCCDIRLGRTDIRAVMPAAKIGLHFYPGGLRRYVTRLGYSVASKLMLAAMPIEGEELLRSGFLTEMMPMSELNRRLDQYLQSIASTSPTVVAQMKKHMQALAHGNADSAALTESINKAYIESARSDDIQIRLKKMLDKN